MPWPKGVPRSKGVAADAAAPVAPEIEDKAPDWQSLQQYDRWVNAGLDAQYMQACAAVREVVVGLYGADVGERMMADIAPILRDPQRERRRRPLRPVPTQAA